MKKKFGTGRTSFDFRLLIIILLLIGSQIVFMGFNQCIIEGQSMNDTLVGRNNESEPPKDIILLSHYVGTLKYKDIIVFSHTDGRTLIKRVIAVGGDTIKFSKLENNVVGLYRLNADQTWQRVEEDYIHNAKMNEFSSHFMFEYDEPIAVDVGRLFVMGDNRNNSEDSRYFGTISLESVSGKMVGSTALGKNFSYYKNVVIFLNFFAVLLYILTSQPESNQTITSAIERYSER